MKKRSKFLAVVLTCIMVISSFSMAHAAMPTEGTSAGNSEESVSVIIELTQAPLLASSQAQQLGAAVYLDTAAAAAAKAELLSAQEGVQQEILEEINDGAEFSGHFTNTINGFAAVVQQEDLAKIKTLPGVKDIYADRQYNAPEEVFTPKLTESTGMIGATTVWSLPGYTGAGKVVAVIDTGVDAFHEFMVLSGTTTTKLTKDSISTILEKYELNAEGLSTDILSVDNAYKNAKFPFCFDYAEGDTNASCSGNEHGVQMAGVIAANGTEAKAQADVKGTALHADQLFNGVAPEAQIIGMKVCSDNSGSASSSTITAAIEDAITLGADVISLGLGSPAGFAFLEGDANKPFEHAYSFEIARKAGIFIAAVAGNEGRAGEGNYLSGRPGVTVSYPSTAYTDSGTLSSPASKNHATAVAGIAEFNIAGGGTMSGFSSWGCTPDLRLKPEITAPGQDIYTTISGDEYTYGSGTSLAAAHIAGAAALMQQYMDDSKFTKYTPEEKGSILESLLMSTADIVSANTGSQYSPRKQGAGLANLTAAVSSDVYLMNFGTGKGKIEIGDGIGSSFSLGITAYNLSGKDHNYEIKGSVFSDASTKITVDGTEFGAYTLPYSKSLSRSEMLSNGRTINAGALATTPTGITGPAIVTVPANGQINIKVEVKLGQEDIDEFSEIFENGFFVEGFLTLESKDADPQPTLSVPYMGYYGDWSKAPILDGSYYFQEYFDQVDGRRNYFYGNTYPYSPDLDSAGNLTGSVQILGGNLQGDNYNYDWVAFSPNGDHYLDSMGYKAILLRNAKALKVSVLDADRAPVTTLLEDSYWRKNTAYNGSVEGEYLPWWDGKDASGNLVPDGQYIYEISATLDYPEASPQLTRIPVRVDTAKPTIVAQLDAATMQLSVNATDEGYLSSITAVDSGSDQVLEDKLGTPANSHQTVLDLSNFSGETFIIRAVDLAGNTQTQTLDNPNWIDPNPSRSSSGASVLPGVVTLPEAGNPNAPTQVMLSMTGSVDENGDISADITEKTVADAIKKAQAAAEKNGNAQGGVALELRIDAGKLAGGSTGSGSATGNIIINLPQKVQEAIIAQGIVSTVIEVAQPDVNLRMDLDAIKEIYGQAKADMNIAVRPIDNSTLTGAAGEAIGNRPVFDISFNFGNNGKINDFGGGKVAASIPYALGTGEKAENVQAVYVDESGAAEWLDNSSYDAAAALVTFYPPHMSVYGVGYRQDAPSLDTPTFTDITNHWAKADIEFVAARGLFSGTGSGLFSPDLSMTRGVFVTALGRLAAAEVDSYTAGSFSDVAADSYYSGYIEWAGENGIVSGIGQSLFAPDQAVTREQMAVIISNYAESIGFAFPDIAQDSASAFADNAAISSWAADAVKQMQLAGILNGKNGNLFDPQGTATRAEVSAVFKRFIELTEGSNSGL